MQSRSATDAPGTPDPALLLAAVQAFPESLAIVAGGSIVYANPAWAGMFECADPSQLQGRFAKNSSRVISCGTATRIELRCRK